MGMAIFVIHIQTVPFMRRRATPGQDPSSHEPVESRTPTDAPRPGKDPRPMRTVLNLLMTAILVHALHRFLKAVAK
jgi:hypothetical protein